MYVVVSAGADPVVCIVEDGTNGLVVTARLEKLIDIVDGVEVEGAYVVVWVSADDVTCLVDDRITLLFRDVLFDGSREATRVLELATAWMVLEAESRLADVVLAR